MNNPENQSKAVSDSESGEPVQQNDRIVLILCGLIASGKSTFAKALEMHFPQFRRCCQDDLGSRQKVEEVAREYLGLGYSICVDRTNVDATQRSHWIKIAREFPGTSVWVIVFDTPYEICAERLRKRASHPTIKSAEQGLPILARFANAFHHPAPHEGYDCILYLQPSSLSRNSQEGSVPGLGSLGSGPEDLDFYTKPEISSILHRVKGSPATLPPYNPLFPSNFTALSGTSAIGPQRRHRASQGYHGNLSYSPHLPHLPPPPPVHHPGFGQDQGNSGNIGDDYEPHLRRSRGYEANLQLHHSQPRSKAAAARALSQEVGADPSNSKSQSRYYGITLGRSFNGVSSLNSGCDGDEPRKEQRDDSAAV